MSGVARARDLLLPGGMLAGTIIGAGMFALPFAFRTAGLYTSFFSLAAATFAFTLLHLFYGDLMLRTPGRHRFAGYARIYLGQGAFLASVALTVVQMIAVMAIYLILARQFIAVSMPSLSPALGLVVFWAFGSLAMFAGLRRIALAELLITGGMITIILMLLVLGFTRGGPISADSSTANPGAFLPLLGPILFALAGRVAIPSVLSYGERNRLSRGAIRRAIAFGTILSGAVYALFVLAALRLAPHPSEDTITGLLGFVPQGVLFTIGALGLLSLWSSYLMVGVDVSSILQYDLGASAFPRMLLVLGVPLVLALAQVAGFFALVELVGGVFLALEGILILALFLAARAAHPEPRHALAPSPHPLTLAILFALFMGALAAALGLIPHPSFS